MIKKIFLVTIFVLLSAAAWGSGFGVFTQGANGLGQANAVVAHPTGPSSLYFNPALLNQVKGRQVEVGTTGIYADRSIDLDSGGSEDADNQWNFPSTFYYTHQANDTLTSGIGIFFPFGLSSKWDDDYEGRYIGTEGDVLTMNINPVLSV
ncbi:MAG: outer membrane protein transport protein, partial [Deltaproteobacteria bacterium]|nr:outer membrane protein transport protein [Deltaproteobacteria bacterium]